MKLFSHVRKIEFWLPALLLLTQLALMIWVWREFLFQPGKYLLCSWNDGMRQYFFFQSYIEQDPNLGWLRVFSMGHPYGEYLLFTDGTPLLAVLFKLISTYVVDFSDHAIDGFHYFLMAGRLLSTWLLYLILRRLGIRLWLVALFALALPWMNPELLKIPQGQFNLSLSWPLLMTVYAALRLYQSEVEQQRAFGTAIVFAILISLTAFLHLYWLALSTAVLGVFLLVWLVSAWQKKEAWRPIFTYGLTTCIAPWLVVVGIVRAIDGYYAARKPYGEGYGWFKWEFELAGFFTPQPHHSLHFIVESKQLESYGSHAYLGNFALFFGLFLLLSIFWWKAYSLPIRQLMRTERPARFLGYLTIGATVSVLIALGEQFEIMGGRFVVNNYLNPFSYLHLLTERITQFRDVSRFSYIGFWTVNLVAIYLLEQWLRRHRTALAYGIAGILLLFVLVDLRDCLREVRSWRVNNMLYQPEHSPIDELISGIDLSSYQAALPIPYFHEGAGDNHYVLDGSNEIINHSMQLQRWGDLPLLSAKFARGNFDHALQLLSLFEGDSTGNGISPELLAQLDDRPVLVLFHETYFNGKEPLTGNQLQPAWDLYRFGNQLIGRYEMELIRREGDFALYRWEIGEIK